MQNIFELIGNEIGIEDDRYYAFDIKKKDTYYYCLGININMLSLDEGTQILELSLKDGELRGCKYKGEYYQSLLNEFLEPENLKQCLQFMEIQRDVLSKENKESKD